jgi:hypothetical protein
LGTGEHVASIAKRPGTESVGWAASALVGKGHCAPCNIVSERSSQLTGVIRRRNVQGSATVIEVSRDWVVVPDIDSRRTAGLEDSRQGVGVAAAYGHRAIEPLDLLVTGIYLQGRTAVLLISWRYGSRAVIRVAEPEGQATDAPAVAE